MVRPHFDWYIDWDFSAQVLGVNKRFIKPMKDIGAALFQVQKPARYVGGCGAVPPIEPGDFVSELRYPSDLYEMACQQCASIIYSMRMKTRLACM